MRFNSRREAKDWLREKGAIKEFRSSVEQLADAKVDQNVLARDAVCELIGDFVALSVANVLDWFQNVLPRIVSREWRRLRAQYRQRHALTLPR
jgi:hypothetical protein